MVYHRSEPGGRRSRDEDDSDSAKESYSRHHDRRSSHRHHRDERSHYDRESSRHDREPSRHDREERRDYRHQEQSAAKQNVFQNDGSFLEMFKKMQERTAEPPVEVKQEDQAGPSVAPTTAAADDAAAKARKIPMVGKRRGGRVLKTGIVKKLKVATPEDDGPKNAWSMYMSEVKKYKEASCEEEGKTRPLVK